MAPYRKDNWFSYFADHYRWSAGLIIALGTAPWGSSDLGEVDMVGKRLQDRVGDDQAWFNEWTRMGLELEGLGGEASSRGRHITASGFNFRACMYYQTGERFRQPKDDKALEVYRRAVLCFKEAAKYTQQPSIESVEIPYAGGRSLPGLFVKSAAEEKGPLPAVVFFDGLDVTKEFCYFWGVRDMVRRGLACLLVDGPGNGESIRFRGLKLRYDYEVPAGAAVDYLESRKDVDPERIGIMALSLGGYYAPRAAAFEKRLKACVAWGAQYDYQALWKRRMELAYKTALSVPPDHIQWVLGATSMEDALKRLENFKLSGVVKKIECPFLMVHGEEDAQVSLTDAQACFHAVGSKDKTLRVFTAEEGGSQHCQNDRLGVAIPYIHDWLAEKLKA
ncbi:MAG: alpha/beta hydrolase [Deltaproteobacteria bacterium]|nr:alpha/beta hydrolase [Deltaproteobacteria bacterium]